MVGSGSVRHSRVMDDVIACRCCGYFTYVAAMPTLSIAGVIWGVAGASPVMVLMFGAIGVVTGLSALHTCHMVEVPPNGDVVLHYAFRERTIPASAITSIKLTHDPDGEDVEKFVVRFTGGQFRVSTNKSCRLLIDRLLELQPSIAVDGYAPLVPLHGRSKI
jgi:hypothetical protein